MTEEELKSYGNSYGEKFRQYEDRIADLEKENAELKSFRQDFVKLTEDNVAMARQRAEIAAQLTKAKEIIKYLLSFIQKENYKTRWDINIAEAEQFISEVEK